MLIDLGDDTRVSVTHHGHDHATQGNEIDAPYTSTLHLSHFSVNQLDSAESIVTFDGGNSSRSLRQSPTTIIGHHVNDLYCISPTAGAHTISTLDGFPSTFLITFPNTPLIPVSSMSPSQTFGTPAVRTSSKSTRGTRKGSPLTNESTSLSPTTPLSAPRYSCSNAPRCVPLSTSLGTAAISSPNAPRSASLSTSLSTPVI
jgi:hypothetical protein